MQDHTMTDLKDVIKMHDGKATIVTKASYKARLSIKRWIIVITILAIILFGVITGVIITWIYHFQNAKTLVLLTLWEVGIVFSEIMILIIIFQYKNWSKKSKLDQTGYNIMVIYFFVQMIAVVGTSTELIWRSILKKKCDNEPMTATCNMAPQTRVSAVLFVLNGISLGVSVLLLLIGIILYWKMDSGQQKKEYVSLQDLIARGNNKKEGAVYGSGHHSREVPTQYQRINNFYSGQMQQLGHRNSNYN